MIPISEALTTATVQRFAPPVPDRSNYMVHGMKPFENHRDVFNVSKLSNRWCELAASAAYTKVFGYLNSLKTVDMQLVIKMRVCDISEIRVITRNCPVPAGSPAPSTSSS